MSPSYINCFILLSLQLCWLLLITIQHRYNIKFTCKTISETAFLAKSNVYAWFTLHCMNPRVYMHWVRVYCSQNTESNVSSRLVQMAVFLLLTAVLQTISAGDQVGQETDSVAHKRREDKQLGNMSKKIVRCLVETDTLTNYYWTITIKNNWIYIIIICQK